MLLVGQSRCSRSQHTAPQLPALAVLEGDVLQDGVAVLELLGGLLKELLHAGVQGASLQHRVRQHGIWHRMAEHSMAPHGTAQQQHNLTQYATKQSGPLKLLLPPKSSNQSFSTCRTDNLCLKLHQSQHQPTGKSKERPCQHTCGMCRTEALLSACCRTSSTPV